MEKLDNYYSSDPKDLIENYKKALELAAEKVKENNWRCNFDFWDDIEVEASELRDLSKTQRKKFRNKINRVLVNPTLRNINSLLWFISKLILGHETSWNIKISEKEERIQLARRKWKVARDISEQLLQEYKDEKGDFYKNK